MSDQAERLRTAHAAFDPPAPEARPGAIVIGSGKGGVGKSTLAILLAAAFARRGRRTLLLDGAQNQGNLHILLGVRPPGSLESLWSGELSPEELLVPLAPGLDLLPADSGAERLYGLGAVDRARLHHRLSTLYDGYDVVLVDGGPGLESVVRATGIRAARLAVIATPEPAALADAYALLKIVSLQLPSVPLEVMVNQVSADEEGQAVYDRLALAADRFLRRELGWLGPVREEDSIRRATRRPGALLPIAHPDVEAIVERLATGGDVPQIAAFESRGTAS